MILLQNVSNYNIVITVIIIKRKVTFSNVIYINGNRTLDVSGARRFKILKYFQCPQNDKLYVK